MWCIFFLFFYHAHVRYGIVHDPRDPRRDRGTHELFHSGGSCRLVGEYDVGGESVQASNVHWHAALTAGRGHVDRGQPSRGHSDRGHVVRAQPHARSVRQHVPSTRVYQLWVVRVWLCDDDRIERAPDEGVEPDASKDLATMVVEIVELAAHACLSFCVIFCRVFFHLDDVEIELPGAVGLRYE